VSGARVGFKPAAFDVSRASARLRAFLPCQYLSEAGWDVGIVPPDDPGRWDCVVFQKSYRDADLALAERLKAAGTRIVTDLCDNHLYNPYNLPDQADRADRMQRMMALADAITVSTPTLAEYLSPWRTTVVDDALDVPVRGRLTLLQRLRQRKANNRDRLRLVWFGIGGECRPPFGLIHLEPVIPALELLHRRSPLVLTVITDSRELFDRYLCHATFPTRFVPWRAATFADQFTAQDICLVPVEANPLTVCKSNNRLVLALVLGLPVVAGVIPSYEEFSDWVLFEDWERHISQLADNPDLGHQYVSEARRYIKRVYTPQRVVEQWGNVLTDVLSRS
jgi:hypothetical protein